MYNVLVKCNSNVHWHHGKMQLMHVHFTSSTYTEVHNKQYNMLVKCDIKIHVHHRNMRSTCIYNLHVQKFD